MERAFKKKVSQQLQVCYLGFLHFRHTVARDSYKWVSFKKRFGCWWVVVGVGGYILTGGGWWWLCFGWWWVVVSDGAYILADGGWWQIYFSWSWVGDGAGWWWLVVVIVGGIVQSDPKLDNTYESDKIIKKER